MVSLVLRVDKESFHIQVVDVFEPPAGDVLGVEACGTEGVMQDVMQDVAHQRHLFFGAGEHDVHKDRHLVHMEAATQNLEDSVYMGSPLALAMKSSGGDHTSAHEEGSQVDNPGHHPLSKLVAGGVDDSAHVRKSHWQPYDRVLVPLLDDAISLPHDGLRRRQLLLEMSELLIVHMSEKIAHHIHTATAHLLVDKEAGEGGHARECRGEDIRLLHILLGNNRLQGGEGERRSQLH